MHTLGNTWLCTNTHRYREVLQTMSSSADGFLLLYWATLTVTFSQMLSAAKYTRAMSSIFTSSASSESVCIRMCVRQRARRGKLSFSTFLILRANFSKAMRVFVNQCLKFQEGHRLLHKHYKPYKRLLR